MTQIDPLTGAAEAVSLSAAPVCGLPVQSPRIDMERVDRRTGTVTRLIEAWSMGDPHGLVNLIPRVVDDLHAIAARLLAREPAAATLEPTALVNELYLRLAGKRSVQFKNSRHFFASMAQVIRKILIDHARQRRRTKRGGGTPPVSLSETQEALVSKEDHLIALDDALSSLETFDSRLSLVVHLRFFVGLSADEVAEILGLSAKTVNRDWQKAKMWLHQQMSRVPGDRS